jgi:hypothetical protein
MIALRKLPILTFLFVLSACSPDTVEQQYPTEQQELKLALVRIQTGLAQRISYSEFSSLVLEGRSRFEVARSQISQEAASTVESAIDAAERGKRIWGQVQEDNCTDICSTQIMKDFIALGLATDQRSYEKYMNARIPPKARFPQLPPASRVAQPEGPPIYGFRYGDRDLIVQDVLTEVASKLALAIRALPDRSPPR